MKTESEKYILGVITGMIVMSIITVSAIELCNASDIEYNANDFGWKVDTVIDALNELYNHKICVEIYV